MLCRMYFADLTMRIICLPIEKENIYPLAMVASECIRKQYPVKTVEQPEAKAKNSWLIASEFSARLRCYSPLKHIRVHRSGTRQLPEFCQ